MGLIGWVSGVRIKIHEGNAKFPSIFVIWIRRPVEVNVQKKIGRNGYLFLFFWAWIISGYLVPKIWKLGLHICIRMKPSIWVKSHDSIFGKLIDQKTKEKQYIFVKFFWPDIYLGSGWNGFFFPITIFVVDL